MNLDALSQAPRLLLEAELAPVQGTRFQPTGFPDLGAAEYELGDEASTRMLLVESAQSMANRLEAVCWDEGQRDVVPALQGMPYVRSTLRNGTTTTSLQEAHRLNSPYIVNAPEWAQATRELGYDPKKATPFDRRAFAAFLLKYDPGSLLHGIFMSHDKSLGGVFRLPRALSAFIEARKVTVAPSGGVKVDRVQPATGGDRTPYGAAAEGFGNVPFHRDEYTALEIRAYFNLDLALLRGLGLSAAAFALLTGLALFKIRRLLRDGLRLRTACDLALQEDLEVTRPEGFKVPSLEELEAELPKLIAQCRKAGALREPAVFDVNFPK